MRHYFLPCFSLLQTIQSHCPLMRKQKSSLSLHSSHIHFFTFLQGIIFPTTAMSYDSSFLVDIISLIRHGLPRYGKAFLFFVSFQELNNLIIFCCFVVFVRLFEIKGFFYLLNKLIINNGLIFTNNIVDFRY